MFSLTSRDRVLLNKAFCTYVHPILEYCSPVWSPHFKYLITKIEHVQRYFTKRLKGCWNMPYEQRLNTLCLESLEHRRLVTDLTVVYQILHGHCDTQLDATFCIIDNSRTRGHAYKLLKPHCTTDATKYFFSNRVTSTCNNLPDMVVHSSTLSTFKRHLSVLDLSCHSQ